MRGGMSRPEPGVPLAERVRRGREPREAAAEPLPPPADEGPARHCWVVDRYDGTKRPALLVEWRTGAAGWEGRVLHVALWRTPGERPRWVLVEEWREAGEIAPR